MAGVSKDNILVWLPSPMGDAILCTPALRAIRSRFQQAKITFLASPVVRQVLSPCKFTDDWIEGNNKGIFSLVKLLKSRNFTQVILFKNSFGSALVCLLALIPARTGYARDARSILLNDRLYPPKLPSGDFKPVSAIDYYLRVASHLGADVSNRTMELTVEQNDIETVRARFPGLFSSNRPLIIFVPGAAGTSKRWPVDKFAKLSDVLIEKYDATILLSVAPNHDEKQIAEQITKTASHNVINLTSHSLSMGELKGLYSFADLVICNDTGPRHIAIALKRKVITLVGPNNPEWTAPYYRDEIFVKGNAPCAPCDKGVCKATNHFCMESISVEMVSRAAAEILEKKKIEEHGESSSNAEYFIEPRYAAGFEKLGLNSVNAVFAFQGDKNLSKLNLASHRSRIEFNIESPKTTLFLKRYDSPPITAQLRNWIAVKKQASCGCIEVDAGKKLSALGVNVPLIAAWGEQWGAIFEKRSFVVIEKVRNGVSLEMRLPDFFGGMATPEDLVKKRRFIRELAGFVKKFHNTGFRHRDLYFSHIFWTGSGEFYLIDLARVFRPMVFTRRYQIKDLAQMYYSTLAKNFSKTDHLRFLRSYQGGKIDKGFIRLILKKTGRIARHDKKKKQISTQ